MGAEHNPQARVQRTAIACGELLTHRGEAILQPVSESAGEAGHVKELTDLAHVHATFQAELLNRHAVVLTVLAAARVARVGAGRQHEHVAVAVLVGFGEHVLHVGLPVAVRQVIGMCGPRSASACCSAASRARFCSLIGETPPLAR